MTDDRTTSAHERDPDVRLPLALITVVAAALRFHDLGRESLWRDEGTSWLVATLPWREMGDVLLHERANMILYFLLVRLWSHIGSGEGTLRLVSAIPGVVSILLIYRLGERWFDRRVGLYAALTLCVSALHLQYSQELRGYALMLMLLVVSAILLDRSGKAGDGGSWAGHVITATLAFYCSTTAAFLLVPMWLTFPLLYPSWRSQPRRLAFAAGSFVLLTAPMAWAVTRNDIRVLGGSTGNGDLALRELLLQLVYGRMQLLLFAGLGVVVVIRMMRRDPNRRPLIAMVIWLVFPFLTIYAASFVRTLSAGRYVLVAWIPLSILVGYSLSRIPHRWLRATAVVVLVILSARTIRSFDRLSKPDWRSVTRHILDQSEPGDGAVFFTTQGSHPFLYYARDATQQIEIVVPADPAWWTREMMPDPEQVAERAEGFTRIWVVLSAQHRSERRDLAEEIDDALSRGFRLADRRTIGRIGLALYQRH